MSTNNSINPLNRDVIIQFLRENKEFLHKEYGVTMIALFGSYARGEETPESDIDLAIEMEKENFKKRMLLKYFLEDHFNKKVDVGYLHSVRITIRRKIEKDLIYA